MRWMWLGFALAVLLMAGCTTAKLTMVVDPALEKNARVYEMSMPGEFSDAKLNVSFGNYRVTEADARRIVIKKSSGGDLPWYLRLLGLSTPGDDIKKMSTSHAYKFNIRDETTWDAKCHLRAEEGEVKEVNNAIITNVGDKVSIKTLSSYYECRYTASGQQPWVLTIEQRGNSNLDIEVNNNDQHFKAHVTAGEYVATDGRELWGQPSYAGYTWTLDNKSIGAVAVREKIPRVWLHKDNSGPTNDVLSMASAGLQIYYWKIYSKEALTVTDSVNTPSP